MEVSDVHVGKQLQVSFSPQGLPAFPPLCFGFGPTAVPGTGFFNGAVLVGSPLSFPIPNIPEASLMVGRALIKDNPLAATSPSIFKVTSRASHLPVGTPIDVMLGDPTGPVGISCFCGIQPFVVQSANIELLTLNYNLFAPNRAEFGASVDVGAKNYVGAFANTGVKWQAALAYNAAPVIAAQATANFADFFTPGGQSLMFTWAEVKTKKPFDIPHPTKDGWRLRYVCVEGPTADVYIKGKLIDSNIIELPDYWRNLVDPETITISLTPFGSYQELFVEKIEWGTKIIVKNNAGGAINCHYVVYGERVDTEKNIPEYEGTWDDYPGDNSQYATEGSASAIKYK
jgi:hypothetical protein